MNKHLEFVLITSQSRNYPTTRIKFDLEGQENWIVIDQISAIDKSRTTKFIGHLDGKTIEQVKEAIKETYVD